MFPPEWRAPTRRRHAIFRFILAFVARCRAIDNRGNLPEVTQEDGEEDGQGVGAVRLALVGLGDGVQKTLDDLTLAGGGSGGDILVLVVEVVKTEDGADGSDGGQEPEGKVSLAVVVDVVDGASVEGVVDLGDGDGLAVQEGLALLFAVGVDGSVVGHCVCVWEGWR